MFSSHSFFSRKALIFFTVMNVLCVTLYPMDGFLCKDYKKKEKKNAPYIEQPLAVPCFEKHIVRLPHNCDNKYSSFFEKNEQNCIIQYLLNDQSVASLLHINNAIRFESSYEAPCNFLLQTHLKADSFSLVTQGEFTFQKNVDINSGTLAGKRINFLDTFSTKKGLFIDTDTCINAGAIRCADALFLNSSSFNNTGELRSYNAHISAKNTINQNGQIKTAYPIFKERN